MEIKNFCKSSCLFDDFSDLMTLVGIPAVDPVLKRAQFNQKINNLTQVKVLSQLSLLNLSSLLPPSPLPHSLLIPSSLHPSLPPHPTLSSTLPNSPISSSLWPHTV